MDDIKEMLEALEVGGDPQDDSPIELGEDPAFDPATEEQIRSYVAGDLTVTESVGLSPKVTADAASRLNIGILSENIRLLMALEKSRKKIRILEKKIYEGSTVNTDSSLFSMYKYENSHYLAQLESVRKYILNNKGALEAITKNSSDDLETELSSLTSEQVELLRDMLYKVRDSSDSSETEDDSSETEDDSSETEDE